MRKVAVLIIIFIGFHMVNAQDVEADSVLKVGVKPAPPFVLEDVYNTDGLSLKLWNKIALKEGFKYELVPFNNLDELLMAVEKREVDMSINPITVTDKRLEQLDFSQPFYISSTVVAKRDESAFLGLLSNVFSWNFLSAVGILILVILIFGVLVWWFERKRNAEEFGGGIRGIGEGFWWSAVTMTTVGYGDKSPRTLGGRIVALIWMFAAIIIISGLTAAIASSLTVQSLDAKVNSFSDLNRYSVGSVEGSSPANSLKQYHSGAVMYKDVNSGLEALANGEIDYFVYDKPILRYFINQNQYATDLEVTNVALRTDYYSFSFPRESPYFDRLNVELVKQIKSAEWQLELAK